MAQTIKLQQPDGIAKGATATLQIPRIGYFNRFDIAITGSTSQSGTAVPLPEGDFATHVTAVRMLLNGNTIQEWTGSLLRKMNRYFDYQGQQGVMPFFFGRPWNLTTNGQNASRLAGHLAAHMTLEVDFKGTADYYPATMDVFALVDQPVVPAPGEVVALANNLGYRRFQRQARSWSAGASVEEISSFSNNGQSLHALVFEGITGNAASLAAVDAIDTVEVIANNAVFHESNAITRAMIRKIGRRTNQTGVNVIEFADKQLWGEHYRMDRLDFRIRVNWKNDTPPGPYNLYLDTTEIDEFRELLAA